MTTKERISLFINELTLIKSSTIRQIVAEQLAEAPEYFFHVPASATGKYHPSYALGEGGLVRHTKAAVQIAEDLFRAGAAEWYTAYDGGNLYLSPANFQDAAYAALILHDTYKLGLEDSATDSSGNPKHTAHNHPLIAAKQLWSLYRQTSVQLTVEEQMIWSQAACAIASHMGKWTLSAHSSTVLPLPDTWLEHFVHLCDYLASRKNIEIKLKGANDE